METVPLDPMKLEVTMDDLFYRLADPLLLKPSQRSALRWAHARFCSALGNHLMAADVFPAKGCSIQDLREWLNQPEGYYEEVRLAIETILSGYRNAFGMPLQGLDLEQIDTWLIAWVDTYR